MRFLLLAQLGLIGWFCGSTELISAPAAAPVSAAYLSETARWLVSPLPAEQQKGKARLAEDRTKIVEGLLEQIRSGDRNTQGLAAARLGIVISPWLRGLEAWDDCHPVSLRPVERPLHFPEAPLIRQQLKEAITRFLENEPISHNVPNLLVVLCETLNEVGDEQTLDWALALVPTLQSPAYAEPLLHLVTDLLGVAPMFNVGLPCGVGIDVVKVDRDRRERLAKALTETTQLREDLRRLSPENRLWQITERWRVESIANRKFRGFSGLYRPNCLRFEPMIRFGSAIVPVLRQRQAEESRLDEKATWEMIIATINGPGDESLIRSLLEKREYLPHACAIIAVSGDQRWLAELDELQYRKGFDPACASRAIAICHGKVALPQLIKAFAANPENGMAGEVIKHLKNPSQPGDLRRHRHFFEKPLSK